MDMILCVNFPTDAVIDLIVCQSQFLTKRPHRLVDKIADFKVMHAAVWFTFTFAVVQCLKGHKLHSQYYSSFPLPVSQAYLPRIKMLINHKKSLFCTPSLRVEQEQWQAPCTTHPCIISSASRHEPGEFMLL